MKMDDCPAALADDVVVRMFVRGFVVGAIAAEIRTQHESLVDEELERAIDGRRVETRQLRLRALDNLLRAQMPVALGDELVPDEGALTGDPAPMSAQCLRAGRGLVGVIGRVWMRHRPGYARSVLVGVVFLETFLMDVLVLVGRPVGMGMRMLVLDVLVIMLVVGVRVRLAFVAVLVGVRLLVRMLAHEASPSEESVDRLADPTGAHVRSKFADQRSSIRPNFQTERAIAQVITNSVTIA